MASIIHIAKSANLSSSVPFALRRMAARQRAPGFAGLGPSNLNARYGQINSCLVRREESTKASTTANSCHLLKARSGNSWNELELQAYNIEIQFQDAQMFFGDTSLPAPSARHHEFLTSLYYEDASDNDTCSLIIQLDLAMEPFVFGETGVIDFVGVLLRFVGYDEWPRLIQSRKELRLQTFGKHRHVNPDVCIVGENIDDVILLVQENKRPKGTNPYAQLVAGAIAAFQCTNGQRVAAGLQPLHSKVSN